MPTGTRRTHPAAVPRRAPEPSFGEGALDSLQLSQMKYFTLLRYADATVMEADLTTGLYHLVYLASRRFDCCARAAALKRRSAAL